MCFHRQLSLVMLYGVIFVVIGVHLLTSGGLSAQTTKKDVAVPSTQAMDEGQMLKQWMEAKELEIEVWADRLIALPAREKETALQLMGKLKSKDLQHALSAIRILTAMGEPAKEHLPELIKLYEHSLSASKKVDMYQVRRWQRQYEVRGNEASEAQAYLEFLHHKQTLKLMPALVLALGPDQASTAEILLRHYRLESRASHQAENSGQDILAVIPRLRFISKEWLQVLLDQAEWEQDVKANVQWYLLRDWTVAGKISASSVIWSLVDADEKHFLMIVQLLNQMENKQQVDQQLFKLWADKEVDQQLLLGTMLDRNMLGLDDWAKVRNWVVVDPKRERLEKMHAYVKTLKAPKDEKLLASIQADLAELFPLRKVDDFDLVHQMITHLNAQEIGHLKKALKSDHYDDPTRVLRVMDQKLSPELWSKLHPELMKYLVTSRVDMEDWMQAAASQGKPGLMWILDFMEQERKATKDDDYEYYARAVLKEHHDDIIPELLSHLTGLKDRGARYDFLEFLNEQVELDDPRYADVLLKVFNKRAFKDMGVVDGLQIQHKSKEKVCQFMIKYALRDRDFRNTVEVMKTFRETSVPMVRNIYFKAPHRVQEQLVKLAIESGDDRADADFLAELVSRKMGTVAKGQASQRTWTLWETKEPLRLIKEKDVKTVRWLMYRASEHMRRRSGQDRLDFFEQVLRPMVEEASRHPDEVVRKIAQEMMVRGNYDDGAYAIMLFETAVKTGMVNKALLEALSPADLKKQEHFKAVIEFLKEDSLRPAAVRLLVPHQEWHKQATESLNQVPDPKRDWQKEEMLVYRYLLDSSNEERLKAMRKLLESKSATRAVYRVERMGAAPDNYNDLLLYTVLGGNLDQINRAFFLSKIIQSGSQNQAVLRAALETAFKVRQKMKGIHTHETFLVRLFSQQPELTKPFLGLLLKEYFSNDYYYARNLYAEWLIAVHKDDPVLIQAFKDQINHQDPKRAKIVTNYLSDLELSDLKVYEETIRERLKTAEEPLKSSLEEYMDDLNDE